MYILYYIILYYIIFYYLILYYIILYYIIYIYISTCLYPIITSKSTYISSDISNETLPPLCFAKPNSALPLRTSSVAPPSHWSAWCRRWRMRPSLRPRSFKDTVHASEVAKSVYFTKSEFIFWFIGDFYDGWVVNSIILWWFMVHMVDRWISMGWW